MGELGLSSFIEPSKTDISKSLPIGIKPRRGEAGTGKTSLFLRARMSIWQRSDLGDCVKKEGKKSPSIRLIICYGPGETSHNPYIHMYRHCIIHIYQHIYEYVGIIYSRALTEYYT